MESLGKDLGSSGSNSFWLSVTGVVFLGILATGCESVGVLCLSHATYMFVVVGRSCCILISWVLVMSLLVAIR